MFYGECIMIFFSHELALQLQQAGNDESIPPPTTREEHERAALEYHRQSQSHKEQCTVL